MTDYVGIRRGKVRRSDVISDYYCGGCGYPVTDHDSYCSECGGALTEGAAQKKAFYRFDVEPNMFDLVSEYARAIENACVAEALDRCEPSLNLHGWEKRRTCRRVRVGTRYGSPKMGCSECGYGLGDDRWSYCPKCGARIEEA